MRHIQATGRTERTAQTVNERKPNMCCEEIVVSFFFRERRNKSGAKVWARVRERKRACERERGEMIVRQAEAYDHMCVCVCGAVASKRWEKDAKENRRRETVGSAEANR